MPSSPARLPLTAAQEGVWLGQQLNPTSPLYNAAECVRIGGRLDVACFEGALRQAVAEAEVLQVRFHAMDRGAVQVLHPPDEWSLAVVDVCGEPDPERAATAWIDADLATVVDLENGPLFAHALFVLAADSFLWYHRAHHIALDGYGFSLVARRVAQLYTAAITGRPDGNRPLGRLREAVEDDVAYQRSARRDDDGDFWRARFADRPDAVSLGNGTSVSCGRLIRRGNRLPAHVLGTWRAIGERTGTTWGEVALALTAVYVHRRTGADEVILGVPMMGRLGSAAARVPVMLMNVVPLRVAVGGGAALPDVVRAVRRELLAIRPHQRYRGEHLRRDLRLVGGERRLYGPLVNIMPFDYDLDFGGHRAVARNLSAGAEFVEDIAIQLHVRSDGEPPALDLDANPNCYDQDEIAAHLDRLVDLFAEVPGETAADSRQESSSPTGYRRTEA
jgi:nonribosomal peptide synthetase MxcG